MLDASADQKGLAGVLPGGARREVDAGGLSVRTDHCVSLRTRAWFGDRRDPHPFPAGWRVSVFNPKDAPPLGGEDIEHSFREPIGSAPICDLARGKKSAAIILDDLSRPTPAAELIPYILRELRQEGIEDERIQFVVGLGAHRPLTRPEMQKKVGPEVISRYPVLNHSCFSDDLVDLGTLDDGASVLINRAVAHADLKIAVGAIIPHPSMGFGGGAKLIVPGVAGFATIASNHSAFPDRPRGASSADGQRRDMRDHALEVARLVGLDAIVNVVVNSRREIAGVFVGDAAAAHAQGVAYAREVHQTTLPHREVEEASVVVINAYPLDSDPVQVVKSTWPVELFPQACKIVLDEACDGIAYHGLIDRSDYITYCRLKAKGSKLPESETMPHTARTGLLFVSTGFPAEAFQRDYPHGALFRSWRSAIHELETIMPTAKVVVLPCAPLQIPAFG